MSGSPSSARLTDVGEHVLAELEVRAYRTDPMTLEVVAGQLDRVLRDLDQVAKTAEYFLAELGPVTPPEALPFLRPVSIGLANRRETPEELAEVFRNAWGAVEVMDGTAADRLMAAEVLNASSVQIENVYAPMMTTVAKIRETMGRGPAAVTVASILHVHPGPQGLPALENYYAIRPKVTSDEAAALLARTFPDPSTAIARHQEVAQAMLALGHPDSPDLRHAAAYLAGSSEDLAHFLPRIQPLVDGMKKRLPRSLTPSVVLADIDALEPAELLNWWQKAVDIVEARKLAPTPAEIGALALGLVHGLPRGEFANEVSGRNGATVSIRALVALHAWIYRPLVPGTTRPPVAPSP
ncbi:MAG: hypothetical protein ACREDK_00760 [Thermoplasmata archaeon]